MTALPPGQGHRGRVRDAAVVLQQSLPAQSTMATANQENPMADDKTKAGAADRARINVNEDYELRDWSKKFGVTPEQLKAAVAKVGVMADDVEKELKKK